MNTKEYNSTAEGQRKMAIESLSISVFIIMDNKIASLGGVAWGKGLPAMLAGMSTVGRQVVYDDLVIEYNTLVAKL